MIYLSKTFVKQKFEYKFYLLANYEFKATIEKQKMKKWKLLSFFSVIIRPYVKNEWVEGHKKRG